MVEHIVRFRDGDGAERVGRLLGGVIEEWDGAWPGTSASGRTFALSAVRLLAPCSPSKIIGIGSNYRAHATEMGKPVPTVPKVFLKAPTTLVGPGEFIEIPPETQRVDHEAELGVVIGRRCSRVSAEHALEYVLGYTVVNDVTARDFQKADGLFARAKGFDSFCPTGPSVAVGLDPSDLRVSAAVNGVIRQDGRTSDMVFDVAELIVFISRIMTLLPGDLIATGTPAGVGPLVAGDRVDVSVEGIGTLSNPVRNREDR